MNNGGESSAQLLERALLNHLHLVAGLADLARQLHDHGYDRIRKAYPDAEAANQQMLAKEEPLAV